MRNAHEGPVHVKGRKPRLGFVGLGNIGLDRLRHLRATGDAEVTALFDPAEDAVRRARDVWPAARVHGSLEDLLDAEDLDGVVISSPNRFHREQALMALERGVAVFCQKPVGRGPADTATILDAARAAGRPFGVDLTYHHTKGAAAMRSAIRSGEIGTVRAIDCSFHNGFGPQQDWFKTVAASGGGCLVDLGVHLVELALWITGARAPHIVRAATWNGSTQLTEAERWGCAEDYARIHLDLDGIDTTVQCSWEAPVGQDALFELHVQGSRGAFRLRNIDRSFYRIQTDQMSGRQVVESIIEDALWRGNALRHWLRRVEEGAGGDIEDHRLLEAVSLIAAARCVDRRPEAMVEAPVVEQAVPGRSVAPLARSNGRGNGHNGRSNGRSTPSNAHSTAHNNAHSNGNVPGDDGASGVGIPPRPDPYAALGGPRPRPERQPPRTAQPEAPREVWP